MVLSQTLIICTNNQIDIENGKMAVKEAFINCSLSLLINYLYIWYLIDVNCILAGVQHGIYFMCFSEILVIIICSKNNNGNTLH